MSALLAAAAFFRLGPSAIQGRIWAEDGQVFLQQAYSIGPVRSISVQYAGYILVVPRLMTAGVYVLPIAWQGVAIHVVVAIVESLIGVVTYVALGGHIASRWARRLVAACVVAVPVGPEVTGNIANVPWFLLFGAAVALFWKPGTRWGWGVVCLLVVAATTCSPFGFIVLALAALRYFLVRSRADLVVLVCTAGGFVVQTIAMIHAPQRQGLDETLAPGRLARGYLNRVLGDGVFGVGRFTPSIHASIVAGVVVFVTAATLLIIARVERAHIRYAMIGLMLGLSVATYLAPIIASPVDVSNPFAASRYYVAPALFLETALMTLVIGIVMAQGRSVRVVAWLARGLSLLIVGSLAFGLISSYNNGADYSRNTGPSWVSLVKSARQDCATKPRTAMISIPIQPQGWTVQLECSQL